MYLDGDVRGECAVVQAREMTACPAIVSQDARFPRPGTCRPSASREVGAIRRGVAALNAALADDRWQMSLGDAEGVMLIYTSLPGADRVGSACVLTTRFPTRARRDRRLTPYEAPTDESSDR